MGRASGKTKLTKKWSEDVEGMEHGGGEGEGGGEERKKNGICLRRVMNSFFAGFLYPHT